MLKNMLRWANDKIGETKYAGWCLSFIEDALEISNDIFCFISLILCTNGAL